MIPLLQNFGVERMIINSACDWGVSDPLSIPKTVRLMKEAEFSKEDIDQLVWKNPVALFCSDDRVSEDELLTPPSLAWEDTHDGNSVLRGQTTGIPKGDSKP